MNPNDQNSPKPTNYGTNVPAADDSDMARGYPKEDELFVIKPPEKKPLDKKSIVLVAAVSIIAVILLVVVLVFALIGSASGLANDYRRLAAVQLTKIDKPLGELEPGAVLNKRNLERPTKEINLSQQSLPSLESVLFVGAWSERYTQTAKLESDLRQHYQDVGTYSNQIKDMIKFKSALTEIFDQEPSLAATVNPADSLTIRSASGKYDEFGSDIGEQAVPPQIVKIKKELAGIFYNKAEIHLSWAKSVEAGDAASQEKAKADLLIESGRAAAIAEDQSFILEFKPSYGQLLKQQKLLKNELAG